MFCKRTDLVIGGSHLKICRNLLNPDVVVVEADKVGNYSLFLKTIYITHIDDLLME